MINFIIEKYDSYEPDCIGELIHEYGRRNISSYSNNSQFRAWVQLKLQILVYYSLVASLGIDNKVLSNIIDSVNCCLHTDCVESVNECFVLGWHVAPFWVIDSDDGSNLFDMVEHDYNRTEVDEDILSNFCTSIMQTSIPYTEKELKGYLRGSEEFFNMVQREEFYYDYDCSNSAFYYVHSVLLKYFLDYADSLSCVEKRVFKNRKVVKEIYRMIGNVLTFHPGNAISEYATVAPGTYIYAVLDIYDGYTSSYEHSQLEADFTAGLKANLLDLLIFELDEELHFLPKEYAGRSDEIFPDFKGKNAVVGERTVGIAV